MVATVKIYRWTGAGPTKTDATTLNIRATTDDGSTPTGSPTAYPIPIPAAGTNYSYWIDTRLYCSSAPATGINNIKWYTDGVNSLGTGITSKVTTQPYGGSYVQATGTQGTSGDQLLIGVYPGITPSPPVDMFGYTSGSPLSVTGTIGAATGDFGDWVVIQVGVGTSATQGPSGSETISWQYDET